MNASSHVLEEILKGFEKGVEGALLDKFSGRYSKDFELKQVNQLYQDYLSARNPEKRALVKKRIEELVSTRSFESSGAREITLKDRRKFETQLSYKHEEK